MSLFTQCKRISEVTPGYRFGGGHDRPLSRVRASEMRLDCSSSCSLALYRADFWDFQDWALSSIDFRHWGVSGYGHWFTVHYSSHHVWIEFHGIAGGYRRFDTSPWGIGALGPRVRRLPRSKATFSPRHWPGH